MQAYCGGLGCCFAVQCASLLQLGCILGCLLDEGFNVGGVGSSLQHVCDHGKYPHVQRCMYIALCGFLCGMLLVFAMWHHSVWLLYECEVMYNETKCWANI